MIGNVSDVAGAIEESKREVGVCVLCGKEGHLGDFHDTEIVEWLNQDSQAGQTNGRLYAAHRRRHHPDYPGFRKDVWNMMRVPPYLW